jgi:hypothetical protein
VKSPIALAEWVLLDLGTRCGTSTTRDLKTISRRVEEEGFSFLTITLSNFGKDLQKGLDLGFVAPNMFAGFRRHGGLPRFLGGFLELIFNRDSGVLLEMPSIEAIRAVRQITLMWAKIELECSSDRFWAAMDKYLECEQDLKRSDERLRSEPDRLDRFSRIGRLLWADFLSSVDSRIYNEGVMPKHGPGSTADKLRGNAKYDQHSWTLRLEKVFPHWENLIPSESFLDRTDVVRILEPGEEIPVKVIAVPKTLKTPRIIAIEPTCMQYMQQGVLTMVVQEMAGHDNPRHFIQFESQEPNQRLAREGSLKGTLATLDLSEASDRVSNQHVRLLLANHRVLRDAVEATRSRKADVPLRDGTTRTVRLAKFASMGSALCFPMEAMVFATVIFCGIEQARGRPLTKRDVKSFFGRVRVYGDDIVIPVEYVQSVIQELEAFGFRVNTDKSFWSGRFRESCGEEYYAGQSVKIARVGTLLPDSRRDVDELESTVSLRNQLDKLYFPETVRFLDELIGKIIPFPAVLETSSLLGRHVMWLPSQEYRHDNALQLPLVKGAVRVSEAPANAVDDYGALMKWFLKRGDQPFQDKDHLLRSGRPSTARIKLRWARPW